MNKRELAVITQIVQCDETCILPLNHHSGRFRSGGLKKNFCGHMHPLTHYSSQNFTGLEPPTPDLPMHHVLALAYKVLS